MKCPLCQSRQARRHCPALDRHICPVCCGTKRQVEIRCPETCGYLGNAAAHPPVAVRRQQDFDIAVVGPALSALTEPQQQLFFLTLSLIDHYKGDGLDAATDADVADAAAALAGTYETASRGLIYEQQAGSLPARRLAAELARVYETVGREHPSAFAVDAAKVLRRLADRIAEAHKQGLEVSHGFLDVAGRIAAQIGLPPGLDAPADAPDRGGLIIP